jgi:YbgC/YbaW family acyl-CoA thioester hydrolase
MNLFNYKTKISFYDCDPAGILFYGKIFFLCHSAYEALIQSFNLKEDYWNNDVYAVPIIHSEASYHKSLKYNETVTIKIKVTQLKSSSFELEYECMNDNGENCVIVKTVHLFVDKKLWKKSVMSQEINKGFSKYFQQKNN